MQDSITDLEDLAKAIREIGLRGGKEEKLKIETEKLLSTFLSSGDIRIEPSYEYTFISGKRADALYGMLSSNTNLLVR
jgi:hypothetical protein